MNTSNFIIRTVNQNEVEHIAAIHTESWQLHYRGILSDRYLDEIAPKERLELWQKRFQQTNENQRIFVVEKAGEICGFACNYLDKDTKWGTLLDNLHVLKKWQGYGLGKRLLQQSITWSKHLRPEASLYLWVYTQNTDAINFYLHNGGKNVEETIVDNPDGSQAAVYRIVWK
ncbi:MAG: GNAT family N-acetyltransferase [Bacteroidota bacterium]